jgi:predicted nucleic acid-binding protein
MIGMKHRIYVETSVISYLAARPSADAVLSEAALGDQDAAKNRLNYCENLQRLDLPDDTEAIAQRLLRSKAMPAKAYTDAVHIAIAALHEVHFISSWNFRHIAGALARRRIETALATIGLKVPVIATPEEILESLS